MPYTFPTPYFPVTPRFFRDGFDEYRFSFNGQEKDDEISGAGNTMAAEFWEYDTRLGRRWNVDPVVKIYESPYACFSNNPICFIDRNGKDTTGGFINPRAREDFNRTYNELNDRISGVNKGLEKLKSKSDKKELSKREVKNKNSLENALKGYLAIKETFDEAINNKLVKYKFHSTNNLGFEDGQTTNPEKNVVLIRFSKGNSTALVHEMRHGFGYVNQEWNAEEGSDYQDELEAWNLAKVWNASYVNEKINEASLYALPENRMNYNIYNLIQDSYPNVKFKEFIQHKVEIK